MAEAATDLPEIPNIQRAVQDGNNNLDSAIANAVEVVINEQRAWLRTILKNALSSSVVNYAAAQQGLESYFDAVASALPSHFDADDVRVVFPDTGSSGEPPQSRRVIPDLAS